MLMVKTVTNYKCEICDETYDDNRKADKCDSRGKEEPFYNYTKMYF